MLKGSKNVIVVDQVRQATTDELDFELYDEFFTPEEIEEEHPDFIYKKSFDGSWWIEGDPMNIDKAIELLQNFKESGVTHIQISPNCDHHDYTFGGLKIRKATKEEIESETKAIDEDIKEKKRQAIKELQKQIDTLENEI